MVSKAARRMVYDRGRQGQLESIQFNGQNSKIYYLKTSVWALIEKLDFVARRMAHLPWRIGLRRA